MVISYRGHEFDKIVIKLPLGAVSLEKTIDKQDSMFRLIASEQSITVKQVKNVISMLDEGNTVPFIARYRKEQTGSLDEVQIRDIMERSQYIQNLEHQKGRSCSSY